MVTGTTVVKQREPALDGLRGAALLIVLVHNTGWISGDSNQLPVKIYSAAGGAGWAGVQLFFVLSGFLITRILLDSKSHRDYLVRFFTRRAFRIFPLCFLLVGGTVVLAITVISPTDWADTVKRHQWAYWLFISNLTEPLGIGIVGLSHAWSLALEEQLYLLWPLVVRAIATRSLLLLSGSLALCGPLVRISLAWMGASHHALYTLSVARVDALTSGALVALVLRTRDCTASWRGIEHPCCKAFFSCSPFS